MAEALTNHFAVIVYKAVHLAIQKLEPNSKFETIVNFEDFMLPALGALLNILRESKHLFFEIIYTISIDSRESILQESIHLSDFWP